MPKMFSAMQFLLLILLNVGTFTSTSGFLPLLSEEGASSKECQLDCPDEMPPRPVCGNDGRTYESKCEIDRAKCQGHNVEFKHGGKCIEKARCEAQRALILSSSGELSKAATFVPECKEDGSYAEVQCHRSTGYCWCVDEQGKPLRGSSKQNSRPNCAAHASRRFNRRRSSRGGRKNRKACSTTDRATFNSNLIDIFESEYRRLPHPPTTSSTSALDFDPLTDTHEKTVIQWKFDQLDVNKDSYLKKREVRDLRRMAKKIVKPKACAKTFAKYCDLDQDKKISKSEWSVCVGVDINNEQVNGMDRILDDAPKAIEEEPTPPQSRSLTPGRPELWDKQHIPRLRHEGRLSLHGGEDTDTKDEEIQDCETLRRTALENHRQDPSSGTYIPNCTPDGFYARPQCHKSTQYCWCVHPRTGKPIRGTATQGKKPDCEAAKRNSKSFKGCSFHKKQEFLDELEQTLMAEMREETRNKSLSDAITPEKAARWKFASIDSNNNKALDKREWKAFKKEWRLFNKDNKQKRRLRKCWRNLPRYCDENNDQKIKMDEWLMCTGVTRDTKVGLIRNPVRRGPNPFSTILKSD